MIVKDEVSVIERCLASVRPYIDSWIIVDTGSTDGTQELIRHYLADLPGALHERAWVDFGHNRTEALELARGKAEYILIMDADNLFCAPSGWQWPVLNADAYELTIVSAGVHYQQCLLVAGRLSWRWVGVLHEYLTSDTPHQTVALPGPWVDRRHEGARSRDPLTYRKDAAILEAAMQKEPHNERYAFYLAQSWRDAREPQKALDAYRLRASMGGWDEEVWYCLYEAARLTQQLSGTAADVSQAYLAAYQCRPARAEPLLALARWHGQRQEWALAHLFARAATSVPRPQDRLFIDEAVYRWQALDQEAIAAYWSGRPLDSFDLNVRLLDGDHLPEEQRARVEANRDFGAAAAAERSAVYPEALVRWLASPQRLLPAVPAVTLTITSCMRLALFEKTVNSFMNCCKDLPMISRFICVDDNSDPAERARMKERYPFFEFILKSPQERGHARSMNLLHSSVDTPYWLHLEDDWHFIVCADYVSRAVAILEHDSFLAQVAFNRNYAETLEDRALVGGAVHRHPEQGFRYMVHEFCAEGQERDAFFDRMPPGSLTNAWWPHFSLRPSLMRTASIKRVGLFSEEPGHFEMEFAQRYKSAGFRTAFFDTVGSMHTGRLTTERDSGKANAYELNDSKQF